MSKKMILLFVSITDYIDLHIAIPLFSTVENGKIKTKFRNQLQSC